MNVLITGGLGFIGLNLVKHAIENENSWNLCVVDSDELRYELLSTIGHGNERRVHPECFTSCDKNFRLIYVPMHLDGGLKGKVESLFEWADAVVHLAALIDVEESLWHPMRYTMANCVVTSALIESCMKHFGTRSTFVHASSFAVYGNPVRVPVRMGDEAPIDPYGATKLYGDNLCAAYRVAESNNPSFWSLRLSNVYGPFGRTGVIHTFLQSLLDDPKKSLGISGDGEQVRDFVYVGDVVKVIAGILNMKGCEPGKTVNICSGMEHSINSLVTKEIPKVVGFQPKYEHQYPGRSNEIARSCGLPFGTSSLGGLKKGTTPIGEGLEATWEWFKNHHSTPMSSE